MRLNFLNSCVNLDENQKVEITFKKIELSMLSNLINSLRNRSNDGAINTAIKDQTVLLNSLIDVYDTKLNDKELDAATRKKFLCMKILALTKLKKIEKQKKLEEIAKSGKNITQKIEEENKPEGLNEKSELNVSDEKKYVSKENLEETINDFLNKEVSSNNKNTEDEKTEESNLQDDKQHKRRTHCYAYIFKKLELNKN